MPSPIEILLDPVSLVVILIYGILIIWESLAPARALPAIKGWWLRGLAAFAVYFYLSSYLPLLWNGYLARYQLFDLAGLGTWGGAVVGLLIYEMGVYGWHRAMHGTNLLWRGFHQMHHSAERLDSYSAFWFSPLDMIGWTALFSLCLTLVVGVTPEAATLVIYATTFFGIFQHSNIRTPRWLGYFLQRPESHSHHHARGVHAGNYSDLPLIDMLFGTFHNPRDFARETGFYDGASAQVVEMLCLRDVSELPSSGARALAAADAR